MTHAHHPGHDARACAARITINAAPNSMGHDGYSCKVTGGHCLPDDKKCAKLLALYAAYAQPQTNERSI